MRWHRNVFVKTLVAVAALLSGAAVEGQQDGDVSVVVHAKTKPDALPTLLVLCDLSCNWKLDGEAKGRIEGGGSSKVKVEPGEHMVEATTEDGMTRLQRASTVKPTGQTMVNIEFQPILDEKALEEQLDREAVAKAKAAQARAQARAQAAKEQAERDAPISAERQAIALYNQKRYGEALPVFHQSCDLGLAEACGWEGYMYSSGVGTPRDYSRSIALYSKACDGGSARDCSSLGYLYAHGKGVQKDRAHAKLLYFKGCSMGDQTGCRESKKIH